MRRIPGAQATDKGNLDLWPVVAGPICAWLLVSGGNDRPVRVWDVGTLWPR